MVCFSDKCNFRRFHRRNFIKRYGSGLDVFFADGDAVERARDAERVAFDKRSINLELEACVLFDRCFALERLPVRLVVFDGDGLIAGLRMFRVANLQGVVACGNAVDRILAGLVRRGGLDRGHAGGDVVCRNQADLRACDGGSFGVLDKTFDARNSRPGFSFREDAGVVVFGTGGERDQCCEGENPCVQSLKVHHALTSGSRFENKCKFIW